MHHSSPPTGHVRAAGDTITMAPESRQQHFKQTMGQCVDEIPCASWDVRNISQRSSCPLQTAGDLELC